MLILGPLGFTAPWLLLALVALPILWFLLRAVPPAPVRRMFPGVILLLGLEDEDHETDKTPWWLLLLRILAVAAVILGFAGPVLNPDRDAVPGAGPLLVLVDGTWADARDWPRRIERVDAAMAEAARAGRPVALVMLTDPPAGALQFQPADIWTARLPSLAPKPWIPDIEAIEAWWAETGAGDFETFWMSDGLEHPWREDLLGRLEDKGEVTVFESPRPVTVLRPARFEAGSLILSGARAAEGEASEITVAAHGLDPAGTPRVLARLPLRFEAGETEADTEATLPPELRNRITRFEIEGVRSAGAVTLADDTLRRREVALMSGREGREGLELLSPTHYLEQALEPTADLISGDFDDIVLANPDAVILADVATLSPAEQSGLLGWVEDGGLLVRFAGPRLAASDVSRDDEDPLMPVRLRAGGRSVGGAMSWGEPKALRPFEAGSPFFGLELPGDVAITAQVMAQPDPTLAERTIASLADGTPLVTRKRIGAGQVVLFHTTANAEWSSLPLSGLFVQMLERLAISTRPTSPTLEEMAGTTWTPDQMLSAFGDIDDAGALPGVPGESLVDAAPGPDLVPGLYAGEDRRLALNAVGPETELLPTAWPDRIPVEGLTVAREVPLKGGLLTAALLALMADIIASLWICGRLLGPRAKAITVAGLAVLLIQQSPAQAQSDDDFALSATLDVVLAHVVTGDAQLDA
ncbi:MAG: BatA domain-containing protein, partial [Pseudomonadota bacterium]